MIFKKFTLAVFLTVAIISGSNCSAQTVSNIQINSLATGENSVDESYSVYSALLENKDRAGVQLHVIVKNIVIDNGAVAGKSRISIDQVVRNISLTLPPEYKSAFEDYKLKNKTASELNSKRISELSNNFNLQNKYILINDDDLKSINKVRNPKDYWEAFYQKYPKSFGYVLFSQVGFDVEKKHAFVYMQFWCGSLCGGGNYILLEKENGVWKETKQAMLWAS